MADIAATVPQVQPTSTAELSDQLRRADAAGLAVVIQGRGTKARWGAPPTRTDLRLSTCGLRDPIDHCAGDLTVTATAGVTLGEVNATLAREGQWLALDPWAGGDGTIGGMLATNDSGPRRHRFGAPRDLVIGVEFVLADGRLAKGGGRVVKNVAGYDMPRLLCGSFGSLAVITAATFKLSPLPAASRTVAIDVPSWPALTALQRTLAHSPLTPTAVELATPPLRLLVRFESTAVAVDQQAATLLAALDAHGASGRIIDGVDEAAIWTGHRASVHPGAERGEGVSATVVRVSVAPMAVADAGAAIEQHAAALGVRTAVAGRALLGSLLVAVAGEDAAVTTWATRVRAAVAPGGHAVVLQGPDRVVREVSPWGAIGPAAAVMRAVKAQFDPRATLCPGGGPGGLA